MSLLDKLNQVTKEREDNYDNPLPNFLRIALFWSTWYGQVFTPIDVIFMMDVTKTAREIHNHNDDTLLDKVGYSISCYERIDEAMISLGYVGIEYFRTVKSFGNGYCMGFMYELLGEYKAFEAKQNQPSTRLLQ